MKSKIKRTLSKLKVLKKSRWKNNNGKKILILTTRYFTKESWNEVFSEVNHDLLNKLDIVFVSDKLDVLKHFPDADCCFLLGYNELFNSDNQKSKLLYFPLIGLEFLDKNKVPENFTIEKPPVFSKYAIAEYCFCMAINIERRLQYAFFNQCERKWNQYEIIQGQYRSIKENKIGILGVGNIGREIALYFKNNGCYVVGCDQKNINEPNIIDQWYDVSDLSDFLGHIDILIISLPLTDQTRDMIGRKELNALGKEKIVINVSRGEIINENELIKALNDKLIKGAVLDVFCYEPLHKNSRFYNYKNVIITPHISGNINLFVSEIQKDFINKSLSFK